MTVTVEILAEETYTVVVTGRIEEHGVGVVQVEVMVEGAKGGQETKSLRR